MLHRASLTEITNPVRVGAWRWRVKGRDLIWVPTGRLIQVSLGRRSNPIHSFEGSLGARLIVGFNVGSQERFNMDDVRDFVLAFQTTRYNKVGASFVLQEGIFSHSDGKVVKENSAQVVVYEDAKVGVNEWMKRVAEMADSMREHFKQESVLLEVTHDGKTVFSGYASRD